MKRSIAPPLLRYGTFRGVFMPSLLAMLGTILYLRLGWVLGQVGLPHTLLIIASAITIVLITALSLSTLATNQKLDTGGAYYVISRSLGLEAGTAIGLPLYFAQTIGIALYILGLVETILPLLQQHVWVMRLLQWLHLPLPWLSKGLSLSILYGLATLAYRGLESAMRVQMIIFGLILLSLVVIFTGELPLQRLLPVAPAEARAPSAHFFMVFAIFFPAVTGIEGGLAMSGSLKNSAKSLPLGTLGALCIAVGVYFSIPIYLSRKILDIHPVAGRTLLLGNPMLLTHIQLPGVLRHFPLVLWALWSTSLAGALSGLTGAPLILQALAKDRILPRALALGSGKAQTPRLATLLTTFIAGIALCNGALNKIATLLSLFFLLSYALLNLAAALEGMLGSPAWRPKFRLPWGLSLLGAFACLLVMFEIAPMTTPIAITTSILVYGYIQRRSLQAHWGDVRSGILMLAARSIVYRLQKRPNEAYNWRPNILVLSGAPTLRGHLIDMAHALSQEKGFLTVCAVVPPQTPCKRIMALEGTMRDYLAKQNITALTRVVPSEQVLIGAEDLITHYGLGPIVPNTVLLGAATANPDYLGYAKFASFITHKERNLMILTEGKTRKTSLPRIDIWWQGWTSQAAFKLAIAFLLTRSAAWESAKIVLKTIVPPGTSPLHARQTMETFIQHTRLDAQAEVIIDACKDPLEAIRVHSAQASLVMLGMRTPKEGESPESYATYYKHLRVGTQDMPPILYTLNSEKVAFRHIFN